MRYKSGLILLTFIIALMLDILPLPGWVLWLRPDWALLVLIFWVMSLPDRVNVGAAFLLGLSLDLLNGTVLGEHALAMVIVAYFVSKFYRRITLFPLLQQMLVIALFIFIYKVVLFAVQGFVGELPNSILYWLSIIVSVVLWPWVSALLQGWRRKMGIISR